MMESTSLPINKESINAYVANSGAFREGIQSSQVVDYYSHWAVKSYDQDLCPGRYNGPQYVADAVNQFIPDQFNVRILDVASGTGQVGEQLNALGYTNIDALDPCRSALNIAQGKNVYNHCICDYFGTSNTTINEDEYDVMVIAGGMGEGHIPCSGLQDMIKVVKPGGLVIIGMREEFLSYVKEYTDRIEPYMEELEEHGKWQRLLRVSTPNWFVGLSGLIYVFRVTEPGYSNFKSKIID
jgi:ubiquinone/menaquinone biosynthesis C-methylase UbiE